MCNTRQYPKATNICSGHLFTVSLSYKQQGIYRKIRKDKKLYLEEISLRDVEWLVAYKFILTIKVYFWIYCVLNSI